MEVDEKVEVFLAHYGVKGMKWGVRKNRTPLTSAQKAERSAKRKKTAKKVATVGAAVAVAAGAIYVNKVMQSNASRMEMQRITKVQRNLANAKTFSNTIGKQAPLTKREQDVRKVMQSGKIFTDVFMNGGGSGPKRVGGAIPMPPAKTKVKDLPLRRIALINTKQDMARRNKEVTDTLKTWYNESDTPIKDRWYPG